MNLPYAVPDRVMLFVAVLLITPAVAQSQTVRGVVVDDVNRSPISGVHVELLTANSEHIAATQTDSAGMFVLLPRRAGNYVFRLTHLGYAVMDPLSLQLSAGEAVDVELRMGVRATPLEPLVVTGRTDSRRSGFHERLRQRRGFGKFVTRADIDARPGATTTEVLREAPGIELVQVSPCAYAPERLGTMANPNHQRCPPAYLIAMRDGPGRCLPTVYLDGLVIKQFADSPIDYFLTPDMLEGAEIYSSVTTAPSPIEARSNCGVVAFWSRTDVEVGRWSWKKAAGAAGVIGVMVGLSAALGG